MIIDRYITSRAAEQAGEGKVDSKQSVFTRCISDGEFKQVKHSRPRTVFANLALVYVGNGHCT